MGLVLADPLALLQRLGGGGAGMGPARPVDDRLGDGGGEAVRPVEGVRVARAGKRPLAQLVERARRGGGRGGAQVDPGRHGLAVAAQHAGGVDRLHDAVEADLDRLHRARVGHGVDQIAGAVGEARAEGGALGADGPAHHALAVEARRRQAVALGHEPRRAVVAVASAVEDAQAHGHRTPKR
jgi:hypothetical protein